MTHFGGLVRNRRWRATIGAALAAVVVATSLVVPTPVITSASAAPTPELPGDYQYPFACTVYRELDLQPLVDNQDGEGIPVIDETLVPDWEQRMYNGYPWRGDVSILAPGTAPPDIDPVTDDELAGWSRDCELAEPVVEYRYLRTGKDNLATPWVIEGDWVTFPNDDSEPLPTDIVYLEPGVQVPLDDPRNVITERTPFIIRVERGTINRFIYSLAALAPFGATPFYGVNNDLWNGRAVYHFGGGVGIGHTQGRISSGQALYTQELQRGFGVIYSTGTATSHHYNLKVGGETALATKARFSSLYGTPVYTVGVGGSGGGIQQYVYGQNHPGLLDGGVPQYSYPDMITQTTHIGDCELLEHYFEKTDAANRRWRTAENRIPVIGLNAESNPRNKNTSTNLQFTVLATVLRNLGYSPLTAVQAPGANQPLTECRAAWTALAPSAMNPTFQTVTGMNRVEGYDISNVEFTHWADAGQNYGYDDDGWARVPWGNVGVQYGLRAVTEGRLTPSEFLRLNALVGSWVDTADQVPEGLPFSAAATGENTGAVITRLVNASNPNPQTVGVRPETPAEVAARVAIARAEFDIWSSRNMNLSPDATRVVPAPRRQSDPIAIANAISSGQVFTGLNPTTGDPIDIPLIDWRHYLEEELDMHNSHQSFAVRQRLINARGNYDNQLVWFTDGRPERGHDQTPMALDVLEDWILTMQANPGMSSGEAKIAMNNPDAVDSCFNTDGTLRNAGDTVWDGILNDDPDGPCTTFMPIYSTSRIEAGAPITGNVFNCGVSDAETPLISVDEAVANGYYGAWRPTTTQIARLKEIFPTGVCDFGAFYPGGNFPDSPDVPFTDINPGGFYAEALQWAVANGITTGTTDTRFTPQGTVTRAQIAAFLWRFDGEARSDRVTPAFPDVTNGAYFDQAVRWMADEGITTGRGTSGLYDPTGQVTRAQVVQFLWKLAGSPVVDGPQPFTDVPVGAFFNMATRWAAFTEITTGKGSPTRFAPGLPVTRAEMVTFLLRANRLRACGLLGGQESAAVAC